MPRTACVTVFQGDTGVDIEVLRRAVEVSFASEREELAYQESDWKLRERSGRVFVVRESLVHVVEDWWPNRTAVLEADERAINPSAVDELQHLLANEYAEWSIGIEVYRGLDGDRPEDLGPIHIYADAILTTKQLIHLVADDA
jgi:hypothetical protein